MQPSTAVSRSIRFPRIRLDSRGIMTLTVVGLLIYLVLGPLLMVVLSSFRSTEGYLPFEAGAQWSLENYARVFFSGSTYVLLANTLIFTAGSLALSFSLAVALAWLVERSDLPFRGVLFVLLIASIGIPNVIAGIAWGLLGSPVNGILNTIPRMLGMEGPGPIDIYTLPGLIFVQGITLVPITFLLIAAAFRAMDPSMEEAAATSGAPFRTVMRRVTLPLLTPALLSALIFQFVSVVESFDIPLIIGLRAGIPLLSTQIFIEAKPAGGLPDYGLAATHSMLLLGLALGPLLFYNRVIGHSERFATVTGRGYQPRRVGLGRWKYPAVLFAFAFLAVALVLPLLVMIWTSLQPFYAVPSVEALGRLTLAAYEELFGSARVWDAFANTLVLGISTAVLTMGLGFLISWILVRSRSRLRPHLDVLSFLPHAFPGVIIGLSVLLIYLMLPLPIYGTLWIIVIAMTTQYVSLSTRLMSGGIAQVERSLEEAAETSGASWTAVLRRIVMPLVMPALLNGFILIFLSAIKNLTLALILISPDSVVVSTLIWSSWDRADTSTTAALGVIMVAITLSLALLARRFAGFGTTRLT